VGRSRPEYRSNNSSTNLEVIVVGVGSPRTPSSAPGWAVPLPPAFVALESAARAALDAVGAAAEWDAPTRTAVLAWTAKHRDQMALVESRVLTAEQQAGTWALRGDRDLAGFAGRVSRGGRGAGFLAVEQAATLETLPAVAEALVDGPVTATHVAQITRATAGSPLLAAELATAAGQARVVELARRFDGAEFGKQLKVMSAELDPAARQRTHDEQRANRFLHISHGTAGTLIKGQLDAVAGYELSKAIGALNPRPAKDDERDAGQRRADALMAMVHRTLADESTTPGAMAPVQAIVTMSQETWAALRAARRGAETETAGVTAPEAADDVNVVPTLRSPSKGSTADVAAALRGVAPVVDEGGRPWPASEIARALCDCVLTRAVVDAAGLPLDLGHDQRLFRRQHWVALLASGITACVWPDCTMPLRNTELHHLAWWDRDDGPTNLDNCGPYCRFHHDWIHNHDVAVTRLRDGRYEHRDRRGRLIGVGGPPAGRTEAVGEFLEPPQPASGSEGASGGPLPTRGTPGSGVRAASAMAVAPRDDESRRGVAGPWSSDMPAEQPDLWGRAGPTAPRLRRTG
jgi:hypothetical protein